MEPSKLERLQAMMKELKRVGMWALILLTVFTVLVGYTYATTAEINDHPTIETLDDEKVENVEKFTDYEENAVCYVYNESISCVRQSSG